MRTRHAILLALAILCSARSGTAAVSAETGGGRPKQMQSPAWVADPSAFQEPLMPVTTPIRTSLVDFIKDVDGRYVETLSLAEAAKHARAQIRAGVETFLRANAPASTR